MGALLPAGRHWATNRSITGKFLDDAMLFIDAAPSLESKIKFCVDAELYTLDLRSVDLSVLEEFRSLVGKVIDYRSRVGGSDFYSPDYFPVYMSALTDLGQLVEEARNELCRLRGGHTPA